MYDRQNGAGDSSNSDISENIAGYWRLGQGSMYRAFGGKVDCDRSMATEGNDRI